jgi:hypothetical protein
LTKNADDPIGELTSRERPTSRRVARHREGHVVCAAIQEAFEIASGEPRVEISKCFLVWMDHAAPPFLFCFRVTAAYCHATVE